MRPTTPTNPRHNEQPNPGGLRPLASAPHLWHNRICEELASLTEKRGAEMMNVSEKAAEKARDMFKEKGLPADTGLRVFVVGGGCSGYQYGMGRARGGAAGEPTNDDRRGQDVL